MMAMSNRRPDDGLRKTVIDREGGRCQTCGVEVIDARDASEAVLDVMLAPRSIPIYTWSPPCWKCKRPTRVATYYFQADRCYTLGEIEKLDFTLMAKYPFVKKQYSRPLECEVVANCCSHCNVQQANYYLADAVQKMATAGEDLAELIDDRLPNSLTQDDFDLAGPDLPAGQVDRAAHLHHADGDPDNDAPGNLVLLCRACHFKAHSTRR